MSNVFLNKRQLTRRSELVKSFAGSYSLAAGTRLTMAQAAVEFALTIRDLVAEIPAPPSSVRRLEEPRGSGETHGKSLHSAGSDHEKIGWQAALEQLKAAHQEITAGYSDPTRRELAWRHFQNLAAGPLWEAVEHIEGDPYRRQLADVLDAGTSRLEAFQLRKQHLEVIESTLLALSAASVTEQDVDACESQWQTAGVSTLPSLGEAFEEWMKISCDDFEAAE